VRTHVALGVVLLVTTTAVAETQDVSKATAFRCFLENGMAGSGEPGKPVEYTPDRFSSNPADAIFTVDVANGRLTGNAGSHDIKVFRDEKSTDILAWPFNGNFVAYTIFHDIPATMPKVAGGLSTKGYRVVHSRHFTFSGHLRASQYVGVCVVTN
jgi:hypothetical protein